MLFNSPEFLVFAAIFFAIFSALRNHQNKRWACIAFASFFFYGWWDWRCVFLLLGSGLLDFHVAQAIRRFSRFKRWWLALSIFMNLATLVFFKYAGIFEQCLNCFSTEPVAEMNVLLPIGISFYTFQSMSYTIDVYRGKMEPVSNPLHFCAYLSMFPQLVAGPIVRASEMLPQLKNAPPPNELQRFEGTRLIAYGLFKKVVVADNVAVMVNQAYGMDEPSGAFLFWWLATTGFAVQIYCDFSGYSDIAVGLGKWMGYELPQNFNQPFLAFGMKDFWSRWHMSLSTWFRDYVYFPLGGSQKGEARGYVNVWITMLLSGLWHGAGWTFVAWGAAHAALLSFERMTGWPSKLGRLRGGQAVARLATFPLLILTWAVFRSQTLSQAGEILHLMLSPGTFALGDFQLLSKTGLAITAVFLTLVYARPLAPRLREYEAEGAVKRVQTIWVAMVLVACVYLRGAGDTFIYFQF